MVGIYNAPDRHLLSGHDMDFSAPLLARETLSMEREDLSQIIGLRYNSKKISQTILTTGSEDIEVG